MSSTEPVPVGVLFEDADLVVVDKPAGIPVQEDRTGDLSLLRLVQERYGNSPVTVGLPHRLDRPVSGAVVLTKSAEALRAMNTAFREGRVQKTYLAIVEGRPPAEGECRHLLTHAGGSRKARVAEVPSGDEGGLSLRFRSLAQGDRFSLLEVLPAGGAFHQIRARLAAIGHAIKGDVKYGARRGEPDRSIALHAWRVALVHPVTGAPLTLVAPDPVRSIWPALLALRTP